MVFLNARALRGDLLSRVLLSGFLVSAGLTAEAQLRAATWNVTNYESGRTNAFRTAIFNQFEGRSFNPDILVLQELRGSTGLTNFLNILNATPGQENQWAAAPFLDTGDTDSGMVYRKNKIDYVSRVNVTGDPRDTQRYDFRLKGYQAASATNPNVSFYSSHWKAGSTTDDESRRLVEATNIRNDAANRPAGTHIMIGGDFNVQGSGDDGYKQLLDASVSRPGGALTGGRFFDPINSSYTSNGGNINWNNSNTYRFLHTQDPYGAGGMDDRLDFMLVGGSLRDGKGLEYIGSTTAAYSGTTWNDSNHSYRVWGNDGTSFNTTLKVNGNTMVGAAIAQALIDSTGNTNPSNTGGHLPVFLDLKVPADLTAGASALNFGEVALNDVVGNFQSLLVSNSVDSSLWGVGGIQRTRVRFSVSGDFTVPTGTFDINGGGSINSMIRINTSSMGLKTGLLTITDDFTGQFRTVQLAGSVVPEPATFAMLGAGLLALARRRRQSR